ncbi:YkvA family protein [Hymenobacter algoricola]
MSSLAEKGLKISKNAIFNIFIGRASKLLGKPFQIAIVLKEVAEKLADKKSTKGTFAQLTDLGLTLVRMVQAFITGAYRQIDTTTVVSGVAVLLYVLSPIDLVPDFIPVVGFLDDFALISWFITKFQGEISRFQAWESTSAVSAAGVAPAPAMSDRTQPAIAELGHS